jgi:AcrR family transcriptional regulator
VSEKSWKSQSLRADAARNVQRIIDAAHVVFSRGGHSVPIEEIAAEAGVGLATLYRRFPHKEDLVKAVLTQRLAAALGPVLEQADREPDPRKALLFALAAGVSCAAQERGTLAAASSIGALTMDVAWQFVEPLRAVIRRGQETGVFRHDLVDEDIPRILLMILGTLPSFEPNSDGWRRYLELLMDAVAPTGTASPLPPPMPVRDHSPRL